MTLADGVTINGPGTIQLAEGGRFVAAGDNVTLDSVTVQSDSPRNLLGEQSSGAHIGWLFRDCIFDNVSVRLSRPGRLNADGTTETTGTAVAGRMEDCEHRNYAGDFAVYVGGVDDVVLLRPWAHHNGIDINAGDGIKITGAADGCQIIDGVSENNTRDGIDIYASVNTTVSGTTLDDNGGLGIDAKWSAADGWVAGGHTLTGNTVRRNLSGGINASAPDTAVTDNVCEGNADFNIRVGSDKDDADVYTETVEVTGNTGTGSGYGVLLGNAVRYVTVDANTLTGNDYGVGMSTRSDQCTVTDNDLTPSNVDDLLEQGTNHTISGNT